MREFHSLHSGASQDVEFIKKGINKGVEWANEAFRIPMVTKKIDDLIWLRNLEDPQAPQFSTPSWPRIGTRVNVKASSACTFSSYMLDLKFRRFLELGIIVYLFLHASEWPHVVAIRLLEIFSAFASAVIRIQTSGVTKFIKPNPEEDVDVKTSQYNFGTVLKETMLSLGPTFIKEIVLHWHIIGKQSFPPEMPSYPKLWKGSYTKWEHYTVEDAYEIVK
ncbi:hypothetical protein K1719_045254 [Acacia pycnantha]|nr:hypothetical protein K1719_045254 [Acacia pycnantha]